MLSTRETYYRLFSSFAEKADPKTLERLALILSRVRFFLNRRLNPYYIGHLSRIFPDRNREELTRMLKSYWRVHQRAFLGLFFARRISRKNVSGIVTLKNREILDDAVSRGKGVLLLVPHFGDERMLHILLAIKGYGMHVISSRYEGAPKILREARLGVSMRWHHVAFPNQPINWLYEALDKGEIVQISPTGYGGPKGHWVWNFGVPVLASSSPVRLAKSTGCSLVIAFNRTMPGMKYEIDFRKFEPSGFNAGGTAELFSAFESLAMDHPMQYNWMNLVIRHRETNTIARLGYIPGNEVILEREAVPDDWDPSVIADPQSLCSLSPEGCCALSL